MSNASGMKFIHLYYSYLESLSALDDAERGRLFTACLEYGATGVAPVLTGNERFVFPMLKSQIDRDQAAYEEKSQMNSRNGKLGGLAKAANKKANASESSDRYPVLATPSDSSERYKSLATSSESSQGEGEGEREGEGNTPLPPKGEAQPKEAAQSSPVGFECPPEFEEFWRAYPRKTEKKAAYIAWKGAAKNKADQAASIVAVKHYAAECQGKQTPMEFIKLGATFMHKDKWRDYIKGPPEGSSSMINGVSEEERKAIYAEYFDADGYCEDLREPTRRIRALERERGFGPDASRAGAG